MCGQGVEAQRCVNSGVVEAWRCVGREWLSSALAYSRNFEGAKIFPVAVVRPPFGWPQDVTVKRSEGGSTQSVRNVESMPAAFDA